MAMSDEACVPGVNDTFRDSTAARTFANELRAKLIYVAQALGIDEPRDFSLYDATVDACINFGALRGMSIEDTLLTLVVKLADRKRDVERAHLKLVTEGPAPLVIVRER
jgi:hypothetical protein